MLFEAFGDVGQCLLVGLFNHLVWIHSAGPVPIAGWQ
jgi:hypothetical protein